MEQSAKDTPDLCEGKIQNIIIKKLDVGGPAKTERCHSMGRPQQKNCILILLFLVLVNLKKRKFFA